MFTGKNLNYIQKDKRILKEIINGKKYACINTNTCHERLQLLKVQFSRNIPLHWFLTRQYLWVISEGKFDTLTNKKLPSTEINSSTCNTYLECGTQKETTTVPMFSVLWCYSVFTEIVSEKKKSHEKLFYEQTQKHLRKTQWEQFLQVQSHPLLQLSFTKMVLILYPNFAFQEDIFKNVIW